MIVRHSGQRASRLPAGSWKIGIAKPGSGRAGRSSPPEGAATSRPSSRSVPHSWQDTTLLVGRALGREAQARKLVADTEARVAKAAAEHPNFKGRTLTLFNYAEGQAYAISSTDDVSIRFLASLGFKLPPAIIRAEATDKQDDFGEARLPVSDERLKLLDADVVLGTSSDSASSLKALVRRPLFQRLSAVTRNAYANLDIGPATSIAYPSVLSINDAIDNLVPVLNRLTQ